MSGGFEQKSSKGFHRKVKTTSFRVTSRVQCPWKTKKNPSHERQCWELWKWIYPKHYLIPPVRDHCNLLLCVRDLRFAARVIYSTRIFILLTLCDIFCAAFDNVFFGSLKQRFCRGDKYFFSYFFGGKIRVEKFIFFFVQRATEIQEVNIK